MNTFAYFSIAIMIAMSAGAVGFGCLIGGWSIFSYFRGASDLHRQAVKRAAIYTTLVELFLGFWFFMVAGDASVNFNRCFVLLMLLAAFVASLAGAAAAKNVR